MPVGHDVHAVRAHAAERDPHQPGRAQGVPPIPSFAHGVQRMDNACARLQSCIRQSARKLNYTTCVAWIFARSCSPSGLFGAGNAVQLQAPAGLECDSVSACRTRASSWS